MTGPQLKITGDGSHTLWLPQLNESYHSTHGAIQESQHVFIKEGLAYRSGTDADHKLKVLEIGFGTGLNAWLTAIFSEQKELHVDYQTLEPFALAEQLINQLNYAQCHQLEKHAALFKQLHMCHWEQAVQLNPYFSITKFATKVEDWQPQSTFDVLYFDAFAPNKQPEIWHESVLAKLYQVLNPNGVLVTYCAQGKFKRALASQGFVVESIPGPPGKKEMTRGIKS